jgi:hypothetical protein
VRFRSPYFGVIIYAYPSIGFVLYSFEWDLVALDEYDGVSAGDSRDALHQSS